MSRATRSWSQGAALCLTTGLVLAVVGGCRTVPTMSGAYDYFGVPAADDAWGPKIHGWQQRELHGTIEPDHAGPSTPGTAAGVEHPGLERARVGDLRTKYDEFRKEQRRMLARDAAAWIQVQSRTHYVPDGPIDHWATFNETMATNGDDCDGLELLTYYFLRSLGFSKNEVYRAIVVRRSDGQHHMVTLWFEDRNDPWVIDPTGAMTTGMPHMSEVPGWVPLKVFSEDRDFTVRDRVFATAR